MNEKHKILNGPTEGKIDFKENYFKRINNE